jgi:hypothetical protein
MDPIPIRQYDRAAVLTLLDDLVADLEASPASERWENKTLPNFLEAFRAWLGDNDGYWHNMGREVPDNPWELIWHALKAAPSYE